MSRPGPNTYIRPWPIGKPKISDGAEGVAAALMAKVAHQLANARRDRFTTQAQLAKSAGVSRHTLSRIEAGSTWPELALLMRLMHVLELDLDVRDRKTGESVPLPTAADRS